MSDKILPMDHKDDGEISIWYLTLFCVSGMAFIELCRWGYIFAWAVFQ